MNEKDLMNAMNEIDDDLLDFAPKKRKNLRGGWKVLIAAVLVMAFSVTAYAIGNITTSYSTRTIDANGLWKLYYGDIDEAEFYDMTVEYQLEPRNVSEKFYSDMVYALNYDYELVQKTYAEYHGEEYVLKEGEEFWSSLPFSWHFDDERSSYTVEELEEYLGIELCMSDELRDGINEIANRRKEGKTSLFPHSITCTGKKVSEEEGGFVPLCATISFVVDYDGKGNFIYANVFICLSEEKTVATDVWSSYEKEGKWTEKILKTDSGREIYFIHNNPEKGFCSKARACWTENGIGYSAYVGMAYDWEFKHEGAKYLIPFVENIE